VADNYDTIINDAAAEWNLDPRLLKALILHESGGDPMAVSKAGAQGLGQIMPETQRQLGVTAPHDPVQSIYGAAKYLNEALDKEGTPDKALLYYHGGPGWRQSFGPESRGYVPAVTAQYVKLAPKQDAAARVQVAQATPTVITDTAPGKPMASEDALKLLPPAPKAGGGAAPVQMPSGGAGTGQEAAPGGSPLDLLPPAPKPSAATTAPPREQGPAPVAVGDTLVSPTDMDRINAPPSGTPSPAAQRIVGAVKEGWEGGPSFPRVPGNLVMAPVYNPLIAGAEAVLSGGNALLRGAQQTAVEVTPDIHLPSLPPGVTIPLGGGRQLSGELTPGSLGREIAALPEAFPTGGAELRVPGRPPIPEAPSSGPRFVQEYYGEGTPANPLAAAPPPERPAFVPPGVNVAPRPVAPVEPPAFVPPSEVGPGAKPPGVVPSTGDAGAPQPGPAAKPGGALPPLSPEDHQWVSGVRDRVAEIQQENQAAGVPGSVGAAATPEELARLTPAQMKAYRKQAELGEVLAPPVRGMDKNIYVHGSEPTLAEYSGDAAVSQKESLHRERAPNQFDERLRKNTHARVDSYEKMEGTAPQLQDLRDAKAAAAEKDGAAYMRVAKDLDYSPAVRWLDEKMADPRMRESPERMRVLRELRGALFDEKGALKTDPGSGWGMHDNLIDRLDKAGDRTAAERYATKLLVEYKRIIDGVNNAASDGAFQTFLDNQAKFAADINSMEELQKFRPKLTNRNGDINATAFHKFVTDLAIRRARPGVDPAMGISDETMRGLIMIDKDLKRASNIDLGKARGSNTNLLFALAQAGGIGAAHLAIAAATEGAPLANLMLHGALKKGGELTGNVMLRRAVRRGLNPPPGGYDYGPVNPLAR